MLIEDHGSLNDTARERVVNEA